METITAPSCTARPVWASGAVNKWGRFDPFTDYRWECGCGHRYNHDGRVTINVQHAQHSGYLLPGS